MSALTRLAEKVEAGEATEYDFLTWREGLSGTRKESAIMLKAYNGSLNAAMALHEAVLPGWGVTSLCQLWDVTPSGEYIGIGNDWSIELHHSNGDIQSHEACATASDPARAWLLAIIRALAQVQG